MEENKRKGKRVKTERTGSVRVNSLDAQFDRFYHAKSAENVTDRTLQSYRENYGYFCEYLDLKGIIRDVRNVNQDVIRRYIVWMRREKVRYENCGKFAPEYVKTKGLKPTTVNLRLKTLKTMFRFLTKDGVVLKNPFTDLKKVEEDDEGKKIMTTEELRTLLDTPNRQHYTGFRDITLMCALIDGFMRISEALAIRKSDIDFNAGVIMLRASTTKGRKTRVIPLQKETVRMLRELIKENEDFDSDLVFLTYYGDNFTANAFRQRIRKYVKKAGLNVRVHPHLFRHTAATMALDNGMGIRHLQEILGHKDLRVIQQYTHLSTQSLKKQHDQYSPLNDVIRKANKPRKVLR